MSSKKSKRGNNEGSIYKRKDGLWCAQITSGRNDDGTVKRQYFYGKTRNEVKDKLNASLYKLSQGALVENNKITVESWLNTWLFEYKKDSIRPTTFQSYEYLIRLHINPQIGYLKLKDLRPEHIQKLYNDKLKSGLSSRTVKYIHTVLHEALKQALKNNLVVRNVTDVAIIPRQTKKEMRVLTLNEEKNFLQALGDDRLRAAYILALGTGVREGELLALRWQDVDLEKGIISINQTIYRVKTYDKSSPTKTTLIFQEPKTKAGKRKIPLPKNVLLELKDHKERQLNEKQSAYDLYQDNDLVFATELGTPIEPRNLLKKFSKIVNKANLKDVNFHALRHTYATRLLEANEHPKVVQELLGHSDISMTLNTYSHVMPEIKKAAANKINYLFENETPNKNKL